MLNKEEIKQALYLNLKNHDWEANTHFVINKDEAEILLSIMCKEEYDERFNEVHG